MAAADYFPSRRRGGALHRETKYPALAILRRASAAVAPLGGAGPIRPPPFVAMKATMSAANPTKESHHDNRSQRYRLRSAIR
jgi:hypothetical protein